MPRICTDFLLRREQTCSAIWTSQNFDSIKWPTVLVRDIKGKPCNFEGCLCASFYIMLFKDQLDRSIVSSCSLNAPADCAPVFIRKDKDRHMLFRTSGLI